MNSHGLAYQCIDLYDAPANVSVPEADALILLGGSMSVNDGLAFLNREMDYLRAALRQGKPVLGICLGAQMIAKALGARVYANVKKEIGWAQVKFNAAVDGDPLFHGCDTEVMFHWHGETFDLPDGAQLLAASETCQNQAFRFGEKVYGLQFHLEVTPDMVCQWCREDESCTTPEAGEPIDPYAHSSRTANVAQLVFGRWCQLVDTPAKNSSAAPSK